MSRILFLSQLVPYPIDAGPKVRSYYVLRHLAKKHQITLLAFSRLDDTQESIQHLQEFCEEVHTVVMKRSQTRNIKALSTSLFKHESFIIRRDFTPEMVKAVDHLVNIKQFDAVHSDQLWMTQYALRVRKINPGIKLILDEHNACFQIFQRLAVGEGNILKRMILDHEWRKLRSYERQVCSGFDCVVTVTQQDQSILEDLVHSKENNSKPLYLNRTDQQFMMIPICVDTQSITPVKPIPGSMNVLFLGTMFWLPNMEGALWFAKEVWPKVILQIPKATFTIAGKNPPPEIQNLSLSNDGKSSIHVTGYVADPQPYIESAGAFIVPLLSGGGMRVKIIDAWRWGIPIISTSMGADGIKCKPGENILIADSPEEFAQQIVKVLQDHKLSEELRTNGRHWVEDNYDYRLVYHKWDEIYPN